MSQKWDQHLAKVIRAQNYQERKEERRWRGEGGNKIKKIERIVFREKQQVLNNDEAETLDDIESIYEIDNVEVKLGSNEDWYLIYGKSESEIKIKDLAIVGGVNSQKNEECHPLFHTPFLYPLPVSRKLSAISDMTSDVPQYHYIRVLHHFCFPENNEYRTDLS